MAKIREKLTHTQIIAIGFIVVIVIGALLLSLPVSSRSGEWTNIFDSLFTSVSATCVTGLVVFDTYTHWSFFGQTVILVLIQIGGLGFMSVITMFFIFMKKQISLNERKLLMQSAGTMQIGGVVRLIRSIVIGTLAVEAAGAVILSFRFVPRMGFWEGIGNAVFHSVSAFCNAGFDLMGKYGQYSSMTSFADDPVVVITLALLIIIGGMGFLVWKDLIRCRFRISSCELHTKIVLATACFLVVVGTGLMLLFEYSSTAMAGMNFWEKLYNAFFAAVTPRTAGFNTIDTAGMSESGAVLTILYMFIGGSSGSTACGVKTTTIAVLFFAAVSCTRRNRSVTVFRRRIEDDIIRQACSIALIYISAAFVCTMAICAMEPLTMKQALYEVVSALGTVGLSLGITPTLCAASRIILMLLMFAGRIGGLSFILFLAEKRSHPPIDRPVGKVLIG